MMPRIFALQGILYTSGCDEMLNCGQNNNNQMYDAHCSKAYHVKTPATIPSNISMCEKRALWLGHQYYSWTETSDGKKYCQTSLTCTGGHSPYIPKHVYWLPEAVNNGWIKMPNAVCSFGDTYPDGVFRKRIRGGRSNTVTNDIMFQCWEACALDDTCLAFQHEGENCYKCMNFTKMGVKDGFFINMYKKISTQVRPTCNDGIKNGNEIYTDCGGHCSPCRSTLIRGSRGICPLGYWEEDYPGRPLHTTCSDRFIHCPGNTCAKKIDNNNVTTCETQFSACDNTAAYIIAYNTDACLCSNRASCNIASRTAPCSELNGCIKEGNLCQDNLTKISPPAPNCGETGSRSRDCSTATYLNISSCAAECPILYLGDGYCDLVCDTAECGYDAGDCITRCPMVGDCTLDGRCNQGCFNDFRCYPSEKIECQPLTPPGYEMVKFIFQGRCVSREGRAVTIGYTLRGTDFGCGRFDSDEHCFQKCAQKCDDTDSCTHFIFVVIPNYQDDTCRIYSECPNTTSTITHPISYLYRAVPTPSPTPSLTPSPTPSPIPSPTLSPISPTSPTTTSATTPSPTATSISLSNTSSVFSISSPSPITKIITVPSISSISAPTSDTYIPSAGTSLKFELVLPSQLCSIIICLVVIFLI